MLKRVVGGVPVLGPLARHVWKRYVRKTPEFATSGQYWDDRYKLGGNSGAGSYNRLAEFKADILNKFVKDHAVNSVVEFGSGDGAQLKIADYPNYIGYDVSHTAVAHSRALFKDDPTKQFRHVGDLTPVQADLTLSLDVIYHLVEDGIFDSYMKRLFETSSRFVIIYASNIDQPDTGASHVRHRRFTDWVEANTGQWNLMEVVENIYPFDAADPINTSFADFYFYEKRQ